MTLDQPNNLHFPKGGIDLSKAAMRQPWRDGPREADGSPSRIYTSIEAVNVRSYEPVTNRTRGGSRVGLKNYLSTPIIADWIIQGLNTVTGVEDGGAVQGSASGRVITVVAVSQGRVFWFLPGQTTAAQEATNNAATSPPLNFSGPVFSSPDNQKLWFVDGAHYRYFVPLTNTVETWTATDGTLPQDDAPHTAQKARLIETWRGRIVLSGLIDDSNNWFMSAISLPKNWDYGAAVLGSQAAISGSTGRLGFIGDVITALAAYNDDLLFFGGNSSIWMMQGDPLSGGSINLITNAIGVAWGRAFTQDPRGTLYFMSNTCRIYAMQPGQKPEPISSPIDPLLKDIDTGNSAVTLIWNEPYKGFHIFVTPRGGASAATSKAFFWEYPRENGSGNAFFRDVFKSKYHYPITACTLDGNTVNDRVVLIGSWDGFIRAYDPDATKDDGQDIEWEVWLGPFLTKDFDEVKLKSLQAVLAQSSGRVNYQVYTGRTAEQAAASTTPSASGTWTAARNLSSLGRTVAGHAIFVRLYGTDRFAMEGIRAMFSSNLSKVRRRGA